MKKIVLFLLIIFFISCEESSDKKYPIFIEIGIPKDWNMLNLKVNNETFETNTTVRKEYFKTLYEVIGSPSRLSPESLEIDHTKNNYLYFIKTDKYMLDDLKDLRIVIENDGNILWEKNVYEGYELSPCGFYNLNEEPNYSKIWRVSYFITNKDDFNIEFETYYSIVSDSSSICDYQE